jgi:malonyl CoA-acyl carrier protein transacylase
MRALNRAYAKAGFSPNTLGLYEAHGTGTPTGDRVELETIVTTLKGEKTPTKACAIGSVKTMIGHTKATAGIAGLVKATLALHHQVIPPHALVESPLAPIADPASPVYLPKEGQPWLTHPEHPRRAGVSAFGFGGTNFHAILEEYQGAAKTAPYGGTDWSWEWLVLRAPDQAALLQDVNQLQGALVAGAQPALRDLAFTYAQQAAVRAQDAICLSLVVNSLGQLSEALLLVQNYLTQGARQPLPPHIQLGLNATTTAQPLAFLFPGQGSQYPGMLRELSLYCPELRDAIEAADRQLSDQLPQRLSQYLYPPSVYTPEAEQQCFENLKATQIAQPLLGAVEAGLLDLLTRLNVCPTMTAGQSYGEYAALYAAQTFNRHDFFALSATRGRLMADVCNASDGGMAALRMTRSAVHSLLNNHPQVVIANHNAPLQVVISGPKAAVQKVVEAANATEPGMARMLPVAGAFHSAFVSAVQTAIAPTLAAVPVRSPKIPVFANETALPYPADPGAIRDQLARHVTSPVNFVDQIQRMYDQGARTFVEVGPKSVLTNMVGQILEGKPITAVSLDGQGGGLRGFFCALGQMATVGVVMNPVALYRGRAVSPLDLTQLAETTTPVLPKMACWLNGGGVRTQTQTTSHPGKQPPLTLETATQSPVVVPVISPIIPLAVIASFPKVSLMESEAIALQPIAVIPPEKVFTMSKLPVSQSTSVNTVDHSASILGAYQSYQETMRQFLGLQERVMNQFLSRLDHDGSSGNQAVLEMPSAPVPQSPVLSLEQLASIEQLEATIRVSEPVGVPPVIMPSVSSSVVSNFVNSNGPSVALLERTIPETIIAPVPMPVVIPAPVVAAAPVSAGLDPAQVTQMLLDIVSDRTGYPSEMLGLEQDMEAELGIDSIKRVEILGAFQKMLPTAVGTMVQEQMESLTRVKSLKGLVDQVVGQGATVAPVAAPVMAAPVMAAPMAAPAPVVAPVPSGLDPAQVTQMLLDIVSDRTGYPAEMLGLEQDMEAELGIDSIKRVEILGALQKSLPASVATVVQDQMESLTRVKSLKGVADQVIQYSQGSVSLGK